MLVRCCGIDTGATMGEKRRIAESSSRRRRTPRVNQRAVKKQETRQRILKAAATIASREGLHAASIPRVMRQAGLTIGGFYGHFESKAAMDAEVIRTVFEPISSGALASFRRHEGLDWLERAVAAYLSPINRDHPQGCPYPSILSAVAVGPPEVKAAFTDAMRLRVGAYEAHAPRLPGVTPRERALAATALTIGGLLLARACRGDALSDEILGACKKWALPEQDVRGQRQQP
jgi:TetR/AcrR family transcriptional repressor of nem operon